MLDLIGINYLFDHCGSVVAEKKRFEAFECYVTDCLSAIVNGLGGKISKRFYEVLHPPKYDDRSAQEIVDDVIKRAGIKVVKRNECIEPDGDTGA